jgi:hypothetical protein
MEIAWLEWRRANVLKLLEHGIEQWEVDSILEVDDWVVYAHPDYPEQRRIVGATVRGRILTIALAPTDDLAAWRPVTGWDANTEEIAYYWDEKS